MFRPPVHVAGRGHVRALAYPVPHCPSQFSRVAEWPRDLVFRTGCAPALRPLVMGNVLLSYVPRSKWRRRGCALAPRAGDQVGGHTCLEHAVCPRAVH